MSFKRAVSKVLQRFGVTEEWAYRDIGRNSLLSTETYRFPSPTSQRPADYPLNFPRKAEKLSKADYSSARRNLVHADASSPAHTRKQAPAQKLNNRHDLCVSRLSPEDLRPTAGVSGFVITHSDV